MFHFALLYNEVASCLVGVEIEVVAGVKVGSITGYVLFLLLWFVVCALQALTICVYVVEEVPG